MTAPLVAASAAQAVLREMRLARRRRRMADLEWFEIVYRAYLVGIAVIYAILWTSAIIHDDEVTPGQLASILHRGPAVIGLIAAVVLTGAMRSGSRGGPLAIEAADVRHLLLAPLDRRSVMLLPAVQRIRSLAFGGAAAGVVVGQALGRRLPSSMYRWAWACGGVGLALGLAYAAVAILTHAAGWNEQVSTAAGTVLIAAEALAIGKVIPAGPFDTLGNLALWPVKQRFIDLVAVAVAVALTAAALAVCGRVSAERLERRTALVAQLRFAATLQDLRTVMLLRRQLSLEAVRSRPWFGLPSFGNPWTRRSWRSFARFPVRRLGRIGVLAGLAALGVVITERGTKPAVVIVGAAAFLIGLELIEPLAQHLDHADLGDLQPHDVGTVHVRLLRVSVIVVAIVGVLAGAITALVSGGFDRVAVAVMLGATAALAGGIGAAVSTVGGAPDPVGQRQTAAFMPPEVAGMTTVFKMAWPVILATAGALPAIAVGRHPGDIGAQTAIAGRSLLGVLAAVAFCGYWFKVRPEFKVWWSRTMNEARNQKRGTR